MLRFVAAFLLAFIASSFVITDTAIGGLSSGAFFTVQYHVAWSSELAGAGVIAGGPYDCAEGSMMGTTKCMSMPSMINLDDLLTAAKDCISSGKCDSVDDLLKTKLYIFSGTKDQTVYPGVVQLALKLYEELGMDTSSIATEFNIPAGHSWPTDNFGSDCGQTQSPYINNCGYNASLIMMQSIFDGIVPGIPVSSNSVLKTIPQGDYTPNGKAPKSISMGENAYVFIPEKCNTTFAACKLVVAVHGCVQTLDDIGTEFVEKIGMLEVAEANGMVVLFPQAIKSYISPSNPEGCWDWWGYTDSNYINQDGSQMQTVHNMVNAIKAGKV